MKENIEIPKYAKGQRPVFFDDPAVDKILAMLMALAGEVSIVRDRLDTVERLLDKNELINREAIEAYEPDERVVEERDARREEYLKQILRITGVMPDKLGRNDVSDNWNQIMNQVDS